MNDNLNGDYTIEEIITAVDSWHSNDELEIKRLRDTLKQKYKIYEKVAQEIEDLEKILDHKQRTLTDSSYSSVSMVPGIAWFLDGQWFYVLFT